MVSGLHPDPDATPPPASQTVFLDADTLPALPPSLVSTVPQIPHPQTPPSSTPACLRKIRSALPTPSGSALLSPFPPLHPADRYTGSAVPGTPPASPYTASLLPACISPSTSPRSPSRSQTDAALPDDSLPLAASAPSATPAVPPSLPVVSSSTPAVLPAPLLAAIPSAIPHNLHIGSATPPALTSAPPGTLGTTPPTPASGCSTTIRRWLYAAWSKAEHAPLSPPSPVHSATADSASDQRPSALPLPPLASLPSHATPPLPLPHQSTADPLPPPHGSPAPHSLLSPQIPFATPRVVSRSRSTPTATPSSPPPPSP